MLCDEKLPVAEIEKTIRSAAGKLLEKVQLFDVYEGAQVEAGKKSVAYSISMRAADRTLTDEEADSVVRKILRALESLGIYLRR